MMKNILELFSGIRWQDILDIGLNSYILFRLYALFRGTHVLRVIIWLALLWFVQRISVSLGLIVTSWAIQGITAMGALIIIVVFRNEIRNVLQARRFKSFLWGFSSKSPVTPVEIVAESIAELARRHIGALLVFPGKESLHDAVQNGISWRGQISKEMILSIFWPDNPVHDGAAVIQGQQVAEVGVILPLSYRKDLPSYYGTRHRAALGLAENTDALVVVVSEERGHVVVAKKGRMRMVNRQEELVEILRMHQGISDDAEERRKRENFRIGLAAFVCLIFITGVWFSFTRGQDVLVPMEVPIEFVNRASKMEIIDSSTSTVQLHLSGSASLMKSIRPEQIRVRLDLGSAGVGENRFTLSRENITLPPGIGIKTIKPQDIQVQVDVPLKKTLPVQVDWEGRLPDQLIMVKATPFPRNIEVVGPSQVVESLSAIYTKKVMLPDLQGSGTLEADLDLEPSSLKIAPGASRRVQIAYTIKEREN